MPTRRFSPSFHRALAGFSNRRMTCGPAGAASLAKQQVSLTQDVGGVTACANTTRLEKGQLRVHLRSAGCCFSGRHERVPNQRTGEGRVARWVCGEPWRRFPRSLGSSSDLSSQRTSVTFLSSGVRSCQRISFRVFGWRPRWS